MTLTKAKSTITHIVMTSLVSICADSLLVSIPIYIFATSTLMRSERVRLILVFSTTLVTTAGSIIHGVLVLRVGGVREGVAAVAEVGRQHSRHELIRYSSKRTLVGRYLVDYLQPDSHSVYDCTCHPWRE